jgi:hypothetical protein
MAGGAGDQSQGRTFPRPQRRASTEDQTLHRNPDPGIQHQVREIRRSTEIRILAFSIRYRRSDSPPKSGSWHSASGTEDPTLHRNPDPSSGF